MATIRIKKGYDLNILGKPSSEVIEPGKPSYVGMLPEKIPFIKPRLKVDTGDRVKVGSVLFEDKRNPKIRFLSPGGGTVENIDFGPRRVIRCITISLDETESAETFDPVSPEALDTTPPRRIIEMLLSGGLWPLLRSLPFRDIADPALTPPVIIVSLDKGEPFQPDPKVYLKNREDDFILGLRILEKLSPRIWVTASKGYFTENQNIGTRITHEVKGRYPAGDPGSVLYHAKTTEDENRSWYIDGQDVLLIAQLLKTGRYPTERIYALSGNPPVVGKHVKTRLGAPLSHIVDNHQKSIREDMRYVIGGWLTGYNGDSKGFMGYYETALALIPKGDHREFLGFIRPGFNKPSYSRTFLSVFNSSPLAMDCNVYGGKRACIACGYCCQVCPVDIFPQLTFKAICAEEVEEYLSHGLLDCVECGLCTYVCPSKIELSETFKRTKALYYKEQGGV